MRPKQSGKARAWNGVYGKSLLVAAFSAFAITAASPTYAQEGFVSDRLFMFATCPIGDETVFTQDKAIGSALLGLARVFAPRILNRTLKGAANGLRKLAGEDTKTATAQATSLFRFYHIQYDDDEKAVTPYLNRESRCIVFVRGAFGDPKKTSGDFGPLAAISARYGRTGPAIWRDKDANGRPLFKVDDDDNEVEVTDGIYDYAVFDPKKTDIRDSAQAAHKDFFGKTYRLVAPPHVYMEATLDPSDDGYFVVTPKVLWYNEKIGNRRDATRDLAFAIQFDDPGKASSDNPGTFANATFGFKRLKIGSALGPAELAGLQSGRLNVRDVPGNFAAESKWAKALIDAETKLQAAKEAIAAGIKSDMILREKFDDTPAECAIDPDGVDCLKAKQAQLDAKIEWINASMNDEQLPSCTSFADKSAEKQACQLKRDRYWALRTKDKHNWEIGRLRLADLKAKVINARKGYGLVGPASVTVSVTETRDVNQFLLALADIISPADDLAGLTQQQVGDIQTAIFQLPPTKQEQVTLDTTRNENNQEYRLALLAVAQKERELQALKDAGKPESEWISVEEALTREKLRTNVAAAKLGVAPPYPELLPP